jgi:hypothetical protein
MTKSNDAKASKAEITAPAGTNEPERAADRGGSSPASKTAKRKMTSVRRRPTAQTKPQRKLS